MMEAFRIERLQLWYGTFQALRNISLDIREREVTALIGASGSGKSSLLRVLNRMHELNGQVRVEGRVFFRGEPLFLMEENRLRRRVGMVFQKPTPFPMSIYDNVAFALHEKKPDLAVEQALRRAALWDEVKDSLKKSALSLSGGQQQRLCLARALAVKPEVLLMDEPTSALDPVSAAQIEALILQLKKHYTIVLVTHQFKQALRVSDYAAYLEHGELVEYAPTAQLFAFPKDARTAAFLK